jgi:pyruvate/2-oxoglutarate/acetoin dehydrogenase E1 component
MSAYKDALSTAMVDLAKDPKVVFIGYGVRYGGLAAGTLKGVREEQLIETPVAENLMAGLGIGLALKGLRPVVFIERMDFILNALDAIVNHLDKIGRMSNGHFHPAVLFRVVIGNSAKPLFTGMTHTQNFSQPLRQMLSFPVTELKSETEVKSAYAEAYQALCAPVPRSTMLVEMKDMY